MEKRLKKYEPLEPLALAVKSKGGLPVDIAERLIDQWMQEAELDMEYDEEGRKPESAFFTQEIPERKKKKKG